MTTGERIKARRNECGITIDTLAEMIGVHRSTWIRYEKGDIEKIPINNLVEIASALSTSVSYLMGWDEKNPDTMTDDEVLAMGDEIDRDYRVARRLLDHMLNQLDKNTLALVTAYVEGIFAQQKRKEP
jgi:transcriptional regulator with XRE-family HTH domain